MKIINLDQYNIVRSTIKKQCEKTKMWARNSHEKKINAILDSICISILNVGLDTDQVDQLIEDINNNNVIDNTILTKGGNLWKHIKEKWVPLAKELFRQRTVGIGTPNAASGEGELMFLFLDGNEVSKPTKGDLCIRQTIFELKGDGARIQGNIRGNDFRKKTLSCALAHGITPNVSIRNGNSAVEMEKIQWKDFYWQQLKKLSLNKQKLFCNDWMKCLDGEEHNKQIEKIFTNNIFDFECFRKETLKSLFRIHLKSNPFDYYVVLGDGTNVKLFSSNVNDFDNKVDNGLIEIEADYFRVNKNFNIGWYIRLK